MHHANMKADIQLDECIVTMGGSRTNTGDITQLAGVSGYNTGGSDIWQGSSGEFWGRATRSVLGVGDQILAAASTLWSGFHRRRRCITACEGCSWCTQTCGPSLPYLSSRGCFALWQVSSRLSTASRDSALRRFVFAFRLHAAPAKAPPDAAIIEPRLDAATAEAKIA